jgi:hypothetical protein
MGDRLNGIDIGYSRACTAIGGSGDAVAYLTCGGATVG